MTKIGPYEVHPAADLFPLISGDEFDQLVASIKENGLQEPIVLNHDQSILIDGRNRYRACLEAGLDPVFRSLGKHYGKRQIVDFIVAANINRRHLSAGQLALLALDLEKLFAEDAKKRQVAGLKKGNSQDKVPVPADLREQTTRRQNESSEQAAKVVGASGRGVQMAKKVAAVAPDLANAVKAGSTSLDAAYKQAKTIETAQRAREPEKAKSKPSSAIITLKTHDGVDVLYPRPQSKSQFNQTRGDGISWASWSWNPVTGCIRNCAYCYAREIATSDRMKDIYPVGFKPLFHHERLDAPANTPFPKSASSDPSLARVFVCSMSDLYGGWVPDEWIEAVHESCEQNSQWQYIHLTKNPARYVIQRPPQGGWLGASVDEQKMVRIAEDAMARIDDAAVRWLSIEPLKEELRFTDLSMFDWIVIGAQTETRQPTGVVPSFAPPFEWVSRIVAQAREAGCKVHLKPNLLGAVNSQSPGMQLPDEYPQPKPIQHTRSGVA